MKPEEARLLLPRLRELGEAMRRDLERLNDGIATVERFFLDLQLGIEVDVPMGATNKLVFTREGLSIKRADGRFIRALEGSRRERIDVAHTLPLMADRLTAEAEALGKDLRLALAEIQL
jgi:hypothetical protein